MRRLALIVCALLLQGNTWPAPGPGHGAYAAGGGGGLTIVQTKTVTSNGADSGSIAFDSNVTSGNVVLCMLANGESNAASGINKSAGTSTIGTLTSKCDAVTAFRCSIEIFSAAVTGTGSLTIAYNWNASATADSSMVCSELSGYTAVNGFAEDVDADDPQAETLTITAGSYVYGAQCDWNATASAQDYVNSPAHTELLYHRNAGSWYTVAYYRSTNTVSGSNSFGMDGGWSNGTPSINQCFAEVTP